MTVDRPLLIFLHLPKTGGGTLSDVLRREYGQRAVLELYDSSYGEEVASLLPGSGDTVRVVIGHLYFGIHAFLPNSAQYVTLLREPVERVVSHYYFVRNDPTHYLYETAQQLNLHDFVIARGAHEPNNDQTRLLSGKRFAASPGAFPDEMLAEAKENLSRHFAVVGLTEAFDESLLLMQRTFGWRRPYYMRRNVGRNRPGIDALPDATIDVIRASNELDIELYHYATALFRKQLRLRGRHEADLHKFKALNAAYGKLYPPLSFVLTRVKARSQRA